MSNRIIVVKNNLVTGLETLMPASVNAVEQRVIKPLNEPNTPVIGILLTDWYRLHGSTWVGNFLVMLAALGETDDTTIELTTAITAAVDAVAASDGCGGEISTPLWESWQQLGAGGAMTRMGAVGRVPFRVENPLPT